jgi:predicted DNA-binding transcriptional regulator AlpA
MSALLTAAQTAKMLGISYSYFRHLMAKDPKAVPPFLVIGKCRRWREESIAKWAEEIEKGALAKLS